MERPYDFTEVAPLLNFILSEPTTAELLKEEEDKIPPGKLHYNEEGKLTGWDRPKWVAENEDGLVIGYAHAWRAPWSEPGTLLQTVVVHPEKNAGTELAGLCTMRFCGGPLKSRLPA